MISLLMGMLAAAGCIGPIRCAPAEAFYLPEDPGFTIVDSMAASVRFTTTRCLVSEGEGLRATSTFVDPEGRPALWHEFGPIEGVGWAANAVGGAIHLIRYGRFFQRGDIEDMGRRVLHYAVHGGFVDPDTGFLRAYRDRSDGRYYLNYLHDDAFDRWFCPGSAAKVALQYLEAGRLCEGSPLGQASRECGLRLARWLRDHVRPAPNGWFPRRCRPDGEPFPLDAHGAGPDPQFETSGDGLYLLWLFAELARAGEPGYGPHIGGPLDAFMRAGGMFGSMNHDTYDPDENVCHAVGFRVLRRIAQWELCPNPDDVRRFAYERCLHTLERFEIREDRNGVATRGLLFMEDSWDTAYLWENAEAATAWFEAARDVGSTKYLRKGLTILRAAARHHHGPHGFLTEGVDWNNHNGQWRVVNGQKVPIHVGGAVYGDVNYTQPFLNNLQIVEPTLFYLEHFARRVRENGAERLCDHEGNVVWRR